MVGTEFERGEAARVAEAHLFAEGRALDERAWDDWLALYTEQAVYWVPAWRDEHTLTSNPDAEISHIYHDSLSALAERVARVRSGKSVTTLPLARTTHFCTNVLAVFDTDDAITASASWMVQVYEPRTARQYANCGRYDLELIRAHGAWACRRKRIVLRNDRVPTLIDFYTL